MSYKARIQPAEVAADNNTANPSESTPSVDQTIDTNPNPTPESSEVAHQPESEVSTPDQTNSRPTDLDKLKHGYEKRLKKMSSQKSEAQSEIEALKSRLAEFESQHRQAPESEVNRDDMTDDEWIEYQVQAKLEETINRQNAEYTQQMQAYEAQTQAVDAWQAKIDAFGKEDYAEVVSLAENFIPNDVKATISQSDIGPQLAYEIAKQPELVESLHSMSEQKRAWTIFNLENKLKNPVSNAKPTPTKTGSGAPMTGSYDSMSMKDFVARRNAERFGR